MGLLVQAPVWAKLARCSGSRGRYQNAFRAQPSHPRARQQTPSGRGGYCTYVTSTLASLFRPDDDVNLLQKYAMRERSNRHSQWNHKRTASTQGRPQSGTSHLARQ